MREPSFWWRKAGFFSSLLEPVAAGYGAIAAQRMARGGMRADVPVLCVGNFTLGGAGKTPAALWLGHALNEAGVKPFFLSRGYGGNLTGPKRVDAQNDSAAQVGDEALLLARVAPTIVARDRAAGAHAAKADGAEVIVMDDGLQNSSLVKDFTLAVVDGRRGIGNGRVFPAGPLRAPLVTQLACCDAMLVIGDGEGGVKSELPLFHGRLVPDAASVTALKGRQVLAFAGIGDPDKFFATVSEAGIVIAARKSFSDHHRFSAEESANLIMQADSGGLSLLTTEKDRARMTGDPNRAALVAKTHVLPVTLEVAEADALLTLVRSKLRR